MNWGNSISSDAGTRASPAVMSSGGKAFTKIGANKHSPCDEESKKPAIDLDMGEASREQGFRLHGCR